MVKGQVSIEYIILVGFVTFIIIGTLAVAFFYSGSIRDRIRVTQVNNFANRIIATGESIYYSGEPSKATIAAYLPDGVEMISFEGKNLFINLKTSSGMEKMAFTGKVVMEGSVNPSIGLKKIQIVAEEDKISVSQA